MAYLMKPGIITGHGQKAERVLMPLTVEEYAEYQARYDCYLHRSKRFRELEAKVDAADYRTLFTLRFDAAFDKTYFHLASIIVLRRKLNGRV